MNKRAFFILPLLSLLFLGCSGSSESPLKVGTNLWPGYECLYLARDLGYYEGAVIELKEYPSASEVMSAYRNGEIDVAALTMDELFLLAQLGHYPQIILIMDFSKGSDAILGQPYLEGLVDLRGKRVGVEAIALGSFLLTRGLEQVNMTLKDVTLVNLPVNKHEKAFNEGELDAVVTFDPVRTKLLETGAKVLFDSSRIPGEIIDVLVVREEAIAGHEDQLQTMLRSWFRALDYLESNPKEAARQVAPHQGLTEEQFTASLKGLRLPDLKENMDLLGENKTLFLERMRHLSRVMFENGLLQRSINPFPLLRDTPLLEP